MDMNNMLAGAGVMAVLMGFIWGVFAHHDKKNETRFAALRKETAKHTPALPRTSRKSRPISPRASGKPRPTRQADR